MQAHLPRIYRAAKALLCPGSHQIAEDHSVCVLINAFIGVNALAMTKERSREADCPSSDSTGIYSFMATCLALSLEGFTVCTSMLPSTVHEPPINTMDDLYDAASRGCINIRNALAHGRKADFRSIVSICAYCRLDAITRDSTAMHWDNQNREFQLATASAWLTSSIQVYASLESIPAQWKTSAMSCIVDPIDSLVCKDRDTLAAMMETTRYEKQWTQMYNDITSFCLVNTDANSRANSLRDLDLDPLTMTMILAATGGDRTWNSVIRTHHSTISRRRTTKNPPSSPWTPLMHLIVHSVNHWVVWSGDTYTRVPTLLHAFTLWCTLSLPATDADMHMHGMTGASIELVSSIRSTP